MKRSLVALAFAPVLALAACGEGTRMPPAPYEPEDDGTITTSTTTETETTPAKRQVFQRDPFGNVAARDNLLWDGDFEWRPPFASQPGWYQADSPSFQGGLDNTKQLVGAQCKSGVKCTLLEDSDVLLGLAVASEGNDLLVSFWVYPEDGNCLGIEAQLWSQETQSSSDLIPAASDTPVDDGWCQFSGVVPERVNAQYLYIHNSAATSAIVDDAVIVAASGTKQMNAQRSLAVTDPALSERIAEMTRTIGKPRILPKSAGELAWEKHNARRWSIRRR